MEPRLTQNQTQKLILSPQMRQYLRLLQLPMAQLATEIEQELTENPVLEEPPKDSTEELQSPPVEDSPKKNQGVEELHFENTLRSLNQVDEDFRSGSFEQGDFSQPEAHETRRQKDYQESLITPKESLSDFLLWQIGFLELTPLERKIAEEIIGNLAEDGYLRSPLEELALTCGATIQDVERVLQQIQSLDPPGIAARNLQETLLIQLKQRGSEADLAKRIVKEQFSLLEKKQWPLMAKHLKVNLEEVRKASQIIGHLDPKPGKTFYGEETVAVRPDAAVDPDDSEEGKLKLEMHGEDLREIRINPYYRRLLKDPSLDEKSRRFLKEKLQSALDFIKALGQRHTTLRNITQEIVNVQSEFFQKGFSHLKPLRLKDISSQLGLHESTISRAIQGKYLSTPYGTLPYKSFFSSRLDRIEGGEESQKSMTERVRDLIRSEDPAHPLSDEEIMQRLQQEGVKIARRTVAKYRELLRILPSHLRRKR